MLIVDKIEQTALTKIEKDIAQYLLDHQENIKEISTRDIAREVYCSSSAVIRLAHKLGFNGYNELKEELILQSKYTRSHFKNIDPNIPFTCDTNLMNTAGIIKDLEKEALDDTYSLVKHDVLQQAIQTMKKSQHIYVFGFGAYVPLATIFQQKMSRIKKHVIVFQNVGEEEYQMDMLTKEDCAIIISYSGENTMMINIASSLKAKQIPMIIMTSLGENTLSHFSDTILYISTREKLFTKIANYSSETSVFLLFDILYSCYFKLEYHKNLDYKVKHSKRVEQGHFSTNQIIQDE